MIKIAIRRVVELESAHANIIQRLVVDAEGLVGVLDELVHRQSSVVWLDNGVGDLWRWHDGKSGHHTVWELFTNFGDEKCTHTSTGATAEGVSDLEALKAVTALSLTTNDIENLVNEFGTLSIMAFGPVVAGTRLAKDKVVGAEELTEWTSTNSIHGTWLKIDEDGTGHELVAGSLAGICQLSSWILVLGLYLPR